MNSRLCRHCGLIEDAPIHTGGHPGRCHEFEGGPVERPILFSSPMVRANRTGRKSQTRRIMNPQPVPIPHDVKRISPYDDTGFWWSCSAAKSMVTMHEAPSGCPYGHRGDRLWVREAWSSGYSKGCWGTLFAADMAFAQGARQHLKGPHFNADDLPTGVKWRPSIHMPRWACRNVYEITEVRVQRLQDISEEDARAEGVTADKTPGLAPISARSVYAELWDSLNKYRAPWFSNPWVFAITYRPVDAETREPGR